MKYRKLGNTGLVVSSLGLGTMYFGAETPQEDAFAILDAFVEAGGNLIDSADVYVGGIAEQVLGRWLAGRQKTSPRVSYWQPRDVMPLGLM
jgi:aryl-alcohol dehydrogenase-like predicted oxidoreductase